jgi:two-component system sensor histidine kinase HydH
MENSLANALGQDATQLAAAEKRDVLTRLLKRLAHEIRNPLSSLAVHFQLLEEDLAGLPSPAEKGLTNRLGIIHGELHRLERIVERFLKLAGPSALELEPTAIEKIITHVCALLRPEASRRQIEILAEIEPNLPLVNLDSVRMTQVLLNLIINSLQAIGERGSVRISAAKSGESLVVRVHDSGPGIATENLADIFDPYFTTKTEGNGLGLWIAQQIAVAHGGNLQAENAAAGGALFTVKLPLERAA